VLARIVGASGIRISSEVYAEENDSFGLSTLTRRHVARRGACTEFDFPAKSGKRARIELCDQRVAGVVAQLREQRRHRLFTLDGKPVAAAALHNTRAVARAHYIHPHC
jgi:DNA topoisomerase IB